VLRTLKSCLSWLSQNSESGIEDNVAATVKPIDPGKLVKAEVTIRNKDKVPAPEQVGRLPWTLSAHTGTPFARLAAALTLLTVQRIETVLSAEKSEFEPRLEGGLWDIPPAHTKSKREHLIPLSSAAWHVVQSAIALSPSDSPLLFPMTRERRKGSGMDGHLSPKAVRDAMDGMGRHALRLAFGTHGVALGFTLAEIKGILDHAEGAGSDVTRLHYELSDGQHWKWRVVRTWQAWVLRQVARQAPAGQERIPAFLKHSAVPDTALMARVNALIASADEIGREQMEPANNP
jgi:integrase